MPRIKQIPDQHVHSFSASEGARKVQTFAKQEARQILPRVAPSPDFLLQIHPTSWCVKAGAVVPLARKLKVMPGVNNVESRRGVPDVSAAILGRNERGWLVVPPEWCTDDDGEGYVMQHRVHGGVAHLTIWERCYPGSQRIDNDDQAEAAFWTGLVRDGKIPGPAPAALEALREKCQRAYVEAANRRRADEAWATEAETAEARLDVVLNAIKAAAPKQKPSKGSRTAKTRIEK